MKRLKEGQYKPIYLLHGEEPFYIDKVSKYIEKHALEEHERDFNQTIFYGRDLEKESFVDTLKRYPMMAPRQVVIVREAQDFSGRWADFLDYFENPIPSTVLVIDIKYKSVDGKPKWVQAIEKHGVVLRSDKHWDNELPEVISSFARQMKYRINPGAANLMAEYLGNDLEKIEMEMNKLSISVPLSQEISIDDVHRLIGISKEFNVFEYIKALSTRDEFRSYRIAQYLGRNDKNNPFVLIVNLLFAHFSKVMMYHSLKSKDVTSVMTLPNHRSKFAANQTMAAGRMYNARQCANIIALLREFDARYKGVTNVYGESQEDLLKELTFKILN